VTTLLLALITALSLVGHYNPYLVIDLFRPQPTNVDKEAPLDLEQSVATPDVETVSLYGDAILAIESDSLFTRQGAKALRKIVTALEATNYVDDVVWMDEIPMPNAFSIPAPLLPHATASQESFDNAKRKALDHPIICGQFLSDDGRTLLMMVNFDFLFIESDTNCIEGLREIAQTATAEFPDLDFKFGVTGEIPFYVTARKAQGDARFFYQTVGYSVIGIMAVILFRGFAAVFVVAIAPALGVFWTLGLVEFFEFRGNPFNDVVLPILVSLVGLTDGVHLMVQIRKHRSSGLKPRQAAKLGISQVGLACALTSLTTAIGFGSLGLANHQFVQEFGYCCVIGVLVTFIAVVTTIPLVCSTRLGNYVQSDEKESLIDKNLRRISNVVSYVLPRKKLISSIAILSTILFVLVSLTLRPDERQSNMLPQGSEVANTLARLDEALNGLEQAGVNVDWEQTPSDVDGSSEFIIVLGRVDELLKSEPLIGHPLSIRNLIESRSRIDHQKFLCP